MQDSSMIYINQVQEENKTLQSVIKALVLQSEGEVVVSEDELSNAELEVLDVTRDERGNFYLRVYE